MPQYLRAPRLRLIDRIRRARKVQGLSLRELAARAYLSAQAISNRPDGTAIVEPAALGSPAATGCWSCSPVSAGGVGPAIFAALVISFFRLMIDAADATGTRDPLLLGVIAAGTVMAHLAVLVTGPFIALILGFGPCPERGPLMANVAALVLLHGVRNLLGASLGLSSSPCPFTAGTALLAILGSLFELGGLGLWVEGGEAWFMPAMVVVGAGEIGAWLLLAAAAAHECRGARRPEGDA